MLNEKKTNEALEALSIAASAIQWLEASSDRQHRAALLDLAYRLRDEAAGLSERARLAGFHPETN